MRGSGTPESEAETVTVLLAGLEITLSARRVPPGSVPSGSVSISNGEGYTIGASARSVSPDFFEYFAIPRALERAVIRAETVELLSELHLPSLVPLAARLRGEHTIWTPSLRLARAFRAGVIARQRLSGIVLNETSLDIPFRNTIYVALRGADSSPGFVTTSYSTFATRTGLVQGGRFHDSSICHGFPTRTEVEAYLCGSQRRWPQEL